MCIRIRIYISISIYLYISIYIYIYVYIYIYIGLTGSNETACFRVLVFSRRTSTTTSSAPSWPHWSLTLT